MGLDYFVLVSKISFIGFYIWKVLVMDWKFLLYKCCFFEGD